MSLVHSLSVLNLLDTQSSSISMILDTRSSSLRSRHIECYTLLPCWFIFYRRLFVSYVCLDVLWFVSRM